MTVKHREQIARQKVFANREMRTQQKNYDDYFGGSDYYYAYLDYYYGGDESEIVSKDFVRDSLENRQLEVFAVRLTHSYSLVITKSSQFIKL